MNTVRRPAALFFSIHALIRLYTNYDGVLAEFLGGNLIIAHVHGSLPFLLFNFFFEILLKTAAKRKMGV